MYIYVLCIRRYIIGFLRQGKVSFYLCGAQLVKDAQLEADTVHWYSSNVHNLGCLFAAHIAVMNTEQPV